LLADHFDAAKRWVDTIHASNPDLRWRNNRGMDWGDWMSAGAATPKEIGATAFFAHSTDLVYRMAQVLGRDADAERYRTLFQGIRRAFVETYVDTNGIIGGDSGHAQGSYALALQFNLLDEPLRSRATQRLDALVIQNGHHPTTGFWSSRELLLALSDSGYPGEAARMMDQHTLPSWGYMADHGTTLWEAFNANTQNLSLNHWTHSGISEWLWRNVAGLNPDEQGPGYRSFTLRPRPTREVSWCQADYDSPRGRISIHWQTQDDHFAMETTIPANTKATVIIPATDPGSVTESGHPAAQAEGVTLLRTEPGAVILQVGSGIYKFRSQTDF
jgi:alpha-L-rhamnosidase